MSFVEVSDELEWASQLMGAMDYEQGFLKNFTKRASLGRGTFGKVFWARSTRDGKRWTSAVKLMESKSEKDDEEWLAYWAQESHIWRHSPASRGLLRQCGDPPKNRDGQRIGRSGIQGLHHALLSR